jgi:acetyl esterase/lipase
MKKTVAFVAAAGVGALAIRRIAALRRSLEAVAPELRTPAMVAASIPVNPLALPVLRMAYSFRSNPGPRVAMTDRHAADTPVHTLVLTPTDFPAPRPAVLWLHAGAMVAGTAQMEAQPAGRLVRDLGVVVVSPDYRLAPENPFPAALDDCMATLHWMREHADELGIDRDRIAVCGASSGGGLAAAVAQRAHDEDIRLRAQALIYPMIDDRTTLRDDHAGRGRLTWSPSSNRRAWKAYLGREPRVSDAPEYASPARRRDVAGLPPAWVGVGELDLFYEENVAYAEKLKQAGVACELVTVPGMYHGADGVAQSAPSMKRFHASMVQHLRTYLDAAV